MVGEIGYNRKELLYELKQWEILAIISGYRRRQRTFCDMTRWQTWFLASTQVNLTEKGITSSEGILPFPWDEKTDAEESPVVSISQEEVERLRELMRKENEKNVAQ